MGDAVGIVTGGWARFEWKIPKIHSRLTGRSQILCSSPLFAYARNTWYVEILQTDELGEELELAVLRTDASYPESMDLELAFCEPDGEEIHVCQKSVDFDRYEDMCDPIQFLDKTRLKEWRPSEELIVVCYLMKPVPEVDDSEESSDEDEEMNVLDERACAVLQQHMKDLLVTGEDHDVILNVRGKHFRTHRSVLQARSSVFHELLDKNKEEVLQMEDCNPDAFQALLQYIYCGDVDDLSLDNAFYLFCAAYKYNLRPLRRQCLNFLENSLNTEIFCDTVRLATEYNERGLLDSATKFFLRHRDEIMDRVEWIDFVKEDPIQANGFFKKIFRVVTNEIRFCDTVHARTIKAITGCPGHIAVYDRVRAETE